MFSREKGDIKIYALGGLGETGKNMYVVEVGSEIFILDSGLMLPEDDMLGIDIVIPDIQYLLKKKEHIKGIFITNAHDEHLGGLPYILRQLSVPVYGTKLTIGVLQRKWKEMKRPHKVNFIEIDHTSKVSFKHAEVTFFNMTYSIPGNIGVCLHTKQGAIVYTGSFKIDQTPVDGVPIDFGKLAQFSRKGVICLLSDSINAEVPGFTPSERLVEDHLSNVFQRAKGRVFIACSSENLHRIQQIFDVAHKNDRKVTIVGKQDPLMDTALKSKVLKVHEKLFVPPHKLSNLSDDKSLILVTGGKYKPLSDLMRMCSNNHKQWKLRTTDTVVLGIKPFPAQERFFSKTIDALYRAGVSVQSLKQFHVTDHASQDELKLLLTMLKPRYFIPVHGEYSAQLAHAKLAHEVGIKAEDIFIMNNGEVLELRARKAHLTGKIPTENVLIDGIGIGDIGNIVLRDRRILSEDGVLIVVVTLNKQQKQIVTNPEILSRGFVYVRESGKLLEESNELVKEIVTRCMDQNVHDWSTLKNKIRESLSHFLFDKTKRRPMVLPIIMEI